jgi:CRISPR/Cas system-associated exonuclease Cas4 (RecB family)
MKRTIRNLRSLAIFGGLLFTANVALAQTSSTSTTTTTPSSTSTTTTSSDGTITTFSPDAIVVKSTTSTTPLSYTSSKTTTYVDESGNTVSSETVKSGAPVTVFYTQDGDKMVATKVIVHKTTTTTLIALKLGVRMRLLT